MRMTTFLLTTLATGLISACDDHLDFLGPDGFEVSSRGGIHGSGNIVTESRSIGAFHGVSFSGIGRLVIEQTGTPSLTVTAEDNIQPVLVSEVVDGRRCPSSALGYGSRVVFAGVATLSASLFPPGSGLICLE